MDYIQNEFCLSSIVLANDYKLQFFTKDSEKANFKNLYFLDTRKFLIYNVVGFNGTLEGFAEKVFVPEEEITSFINEEKKFYIYNPLSDTPEMYLEMNKIKIFNDSSLLKFIKNYGIPFDKQIVKGQITSTDLFPMRETNKLYYAMDVIFFYEGLFKLQNAINIWHFIQENNIEEMEKIKSKFKQSIQNGFIDSKFHDRVDLSGLMTNDLIPYFRDKSADWDFTWEEVKNKAPKRIALSYLNILLTKIKSGEKTNCFKDGKIVPAIRFNNLLEVAGYQFKQTIFKNKKFEQCLNCGALFEPLHAHQKFCSPLPRRKRSTCENTYNQRQKRMRKKQE